MELGKSYNRALSDASMIKSFAAELGFLGFGIPSISAWYTPPIKSEIVSGSSEHFQYFDMAEQIANKWNELRIAKDFQAADSLKASASLAGLRIEALTDACKRIDRGLAGR